MQSHIPIILLLNNFNVIDLIIGKHCGRDKNNVDIKNSIKTIAKSSKS